MVEKLYVIRNQQYVESGKFQCSLCGIVHNFEEHAEDCCSPKCRCCKTEINNRSGLCSTCYALAVEEGEKQKYANARLVPWKDYEDTVVYFRDRFFALEDLREAHPRPPETYAWGVHRYSVQAGVDEEYFIDPDDLPEDFDCYDVKGFAEMYSKVKEAVEEFNVKQIPEFYRIDESTAVIFDEEFWLYN